MKNSWCAASVSLNSRRFPVWTALVRSLTKERVGMDAIDRSRSTFVQTYPNWVRLYFRIKVNFGILPSRILIGIKNNNINLQHTIQTSVDFKRETKSFFLYRWIDNNWIPFVFLTSHCTMLKCVGEFFLCLRNTGEVSTLWKHSKMTLPFWNDQQTWPIFQHSIGKWQFDR